MKKVAVTKELLSIANELDNLSLYEEANKITKIANTVLAEDMKHDPMVFNPDDSASDKLDAMSSEFDQLIDMLNDAKNSGELDDEDMHSIMNILQQESGRKSTEMSFDEDDDDEDDDYEYNDDDYDMGEENEPFDYDSPEDDEDMYGGADSRFPDLDEDDF